MNKPIITKLENGLTVVVDNNASVNSIVVALGVNVGSRNETSSQGGISHFLEHMNFKGTSKRSAIEIAEAVEHVGGSFNAYTSKSETVYYTKMLKENLGLGIDIISDLTLNSIFPESEFEKEKQVVMQEIKRSKDSPMSLLYEEMAKETFPGQSLGLTTLGTCEQIENYTTEDLRTYRNDYYIPENMVFSFSGNIKNDEVIALVEEKFNIERTINEDIKNIYDIDAKFTEAHVLKNKIDLSQAIVRLGWDIGSDGIEEFLLMSFFSELFGGGMSSRLFQKIREEKGLVYSVSSGYYALPDHGSFMIQGGTSLGQVNEFILESCKLLKELKGSITDLEMERTFNGFKSYLLMFKESIQNVATDNINDLFHYGRIIQVDEINRILGDITIDKMNACVDNLLSTKLSVGVLADFSKDGKEKIYTLEEIKNILN